MWCASRLIQPVAVDIDKLPASASMTGTTVGNLPLATVVNDSATLKAELLRSFEITKLQGRSCG